MELVFAICGGVALSAACGFRVFVPLLALGVAALTGVIDPTKNLEWVGTWPAVITFAVATLVEVAGYYVPWVDNALDAIATPAAVAAGTLATATTLPEMNPAMKWTLALVAGGGAAGIIQTGTVFTRALSSATTAGAANPVVSTAEALAALLLSLLALLVPVVAAVLVLAVLVWAVKRIIRGRRRPVPGHASG